MEQTEAVIKALALIEKLSPTKETEPESKVIEAMSTDPWSLRAHVIFRWIWKITLAAALGIDLGLLILSF